MTFKKYGKLLYIGILHNLHFTLQYLKTYLQTHRLLPDSGIYKHMGVSNDPAWEIITEPTFP